MRRLFALLIVFAACGDDGATTPSTKNLHGYWSFEKPQTLPLDQWVFGFIPADQVATAFYDPEVTVPPNKDLGVVYWRGADGDAADLQITTYEVSGDQLLQTVIADTGSLPGTMYGTKIIDFDESMMTLESKNDPSGMRTYLKKPRCPIETIVGWSRSGALAPPDVSARNAAVAVGAAGQIHTLVGGTYQYLADGCTPTIDPSIPDFRQASIALRGEEVHAALEGFDLQGGPDDSAIFYSWHTGPGAPWQTEMIAPRAASGSPLSHLSLFFHGDERVVVASHTNGELEMFRGTTGSWQGVSLSMPVPRVEDAAITPTGDVVLLSLDKLRIVRGSVVEEVALPRPHFDVAVNGGIAVDGAGRIHAAWPYALASNQGFVGGTRSVYGVYDGTWTLHELGPATYPRPLPTVAGARRVLAAYTRGGDPAFFLTEIAADGAETSARVSIEPSFGTSPPISAKLAAAVGPDGTIAYSWSGHAVQARRPDRLRDPWMIDYTVRITGPGRVHSTDGRIDCTATCTIKVPLGTRLKLAIEPGPGKQIADSSCPFEDSHRVDGWCWHDVSFEMVDFRVKEIVHVVMFY